MSIPHPAAPGVQWRPAALDDAGAIARFAAEVDAVEDLEFTGGPDFWRWWLPQHDPEADTLIGVDGEGRVVALGGSYASDTPSGARAILWLDAHPDYPGLEAPLLAWVTARGWEQIAGSSHGRGVLRTSVEEHRHRRRRVLEDAGFAAARVFVEMRRPLTGELPGEPPLPAGVEVAHWDPSLDEALRLAANAAFADHWGSLPMDGNTWASMVVDEEVIRRDLSRLAVEEGKVVSFCLAEVDREEDAGRLWIDRIGTIPSHRRRGLAGALLARTLRAGAAAGFGSTGLTTDQDGRFEATTLYTRLGYRELRRSITYVREAAE